MSIRRIAIVGAGITGLTAAYRLSEAGEHVTVLEANECAGGPIQSPRKEGFQLERGPHTILEKNLAIARLIDDLGLGDDVVEASSEAKKRFVVRDGHLHPVPMSPLEMVTSDLLSGRAKLRALLEPFRSKGPERDESLANFIRRRLGPEVLEYAVGPLVGGIFAGKPSRLSARHAFTRMYELERDHGSLTRGMIARMLSGLFDDAEKPGRRLLSFESGSHRIVDALTDALDDSIRYGFRVAGMRRSESGEWTISSATEESAGGFDEVIWTAPAYALPDISLGNAHDSDEDLAAFGDVYYPPVAIVALGFRRSQIDHPLDGFGFLMPESEPYRILGSLFMSSIFPGRAPEGRCLLSTFVGGSRQPELVNRPDDALVNMVVDDLRDLVGARGQPEMSDVFTWERAIPQYELGYGRILDRFEQIESRYDGLRFTGSFRNGIAVPDLVAAATETASSMLN
mgnify:CR=1 FL=1